MDVPKEKSFTTRVFHRIISLFKNRWFNYSSKWETYYQRIENSNDPIWDEVLVVLAKTKPDIIGISVSNVTVSSALKIAKIAKGYNSNIKVIFGGPAATIIPDYVLENKSVDFLVYGEGEISTANLTEHILKNQLSSQILKQVKGIVFRDSEKIVKTEPQSLIQDLNKLPFPDRESMFRVNEKRELQKIYSNGDVLTSRGCPYLCKFCACFKIWGTRTPRSRSVKNIIDEISYLVQTYGQSSFVFWDDLFTVNKKHVIELCNEIIKQNLNIKWVCLARLNNIDREMIEAMKRAGCWQIQVGIESGCNRVLKFINKNLTIDLIKKKTKILRDSNINWLAFFIVGFPTETKGEIIQTLNFIKTIRPTTVGISIFSPYPGTELHTYINEHGLSKKSENYIKNDTWYIENNYSGTMSDSEFKEIAERALKFGDKYNSIYKRFPRMGFDRVQKWFRKNN